ncbi:UV damage repair endonuclease UvdE [Clostridium botulinum]|uniref:UV DNA damage repair endonuclease UvsE n=1 Tax=Clostridium botulinum TaxID=1491 RepID=A0A6B4HPA6_CLOBO|nr:UV DNA damage repair endonuclease UvsE [Clostridium botulinum]ACD52140.1 UV damage endonuclease UvdE [Clostridium botulinum E3 str. Alaska E43]AJF30146.1 UV damage repair endonuclease UvdE [Clostridium botulinum]AJF33209.1 UV damage repair endonuclease UvdE [Clostridium botulinum]MBN1035988.1 UV DNA damage repair endonuclease UvsE [Clostridium botulinum]MBY6788657.1 UV DNA damage repair endonuclease UvsE [Clostridium botulinum]
MKVRLGYVSIAMNLGKKVTSSSTVTFKNYSKITEQEKKNEKLKSVTLSNLNDLIKILKYNIENNIHFYRITSALIPLVTHPEVGYWGHRELFKKDFKYIGGIIKESNMRVDTHPDEFNVINSINPQVVENTKLNLIRQAEWFEDFDYKEGKMVIHLGGATGGKEEGIKRFIKNFKEFPKEITSRLIIENDDKTYTAREILNVCEELEVPMVLDVHHHNCNNSGENIMELIEDIFNTWNEESLPPKIHFSTPRENEKDRKHSDFINSSDFVDFIEKTKVIDRDFDVMLECKQKDLALFKLVEEIKKIKPNYKWIDQSTFEV